MHGNPKRETTTNSRMFALFFSSENDSKCSEIFYCRSNYGLVQGELVCVWCPPTSILTIYIDFVFKVIKSIPTCPVRIPCTLDT